MAEHGPGQRHSSRRRETQRYFTEPRLPAYEGAAYRPFTASFGFGFGRLCFRHSGRPLVRQKTSPIDSETWTAHFCGYRHFHYFCNKAVSELVKSPDKSRFMRIVSQNRSDLLDALNNSIVGDRRALPEVLNQLFLADKPLPPLDHVQK